MCRSALPVVMFLLMGVLAGCGSKNKGAGPDGKAQDGGAAQAPPVIAKLDFSKGPNGEEVAKVETSERVYFAFQNKSKTKVRHGLYTEFYDKGKAKKKVEGDCFAGEWHGTVTEWYESGEKRAERFYDRGKGVGTHQGFDKEGKVAWSLPFDSNGTPLLTKSSTKAALSQIRFIAGWRSLPKDQKADVSVYWHMIGDVRRNPPPEGQRFVQLYLDNGGGDVKYSTVLGHLGAPIDIYHEKQTKGTSPSFKTLAFQCSDGYVRIGINNTDWLRRHSEAIHKAGRDIPLDSIPFLDANDKIQLFMKIAVNSDKEL